MQSLLLPAPWFSKSHFGPHRFDIDSGRVSLPLRSPSTGAKSNRGASYSAHPMSGNLPASTQPESADATQRDRELRAETTVSIDTTHSNLPPRLPTLNPVETTSAAQPTRFFAPEELRSNPTSQVSGIGSANTLSHVVSESPQLHGLSAASAVRTLPPRSTRRAKAHVASACVNCKRKHLGCDSARPCRRCVLSGKAATCVDVTHKKRGRPPLRAEETTLRGAPPLESSAASREQYHQATTGRGLGHSKTSSREIRPITDLQYSRPPEHGTAGLGSGTIPMVASSGRWQPFPSPQILSAGHSQRPVSSSGPPPAPSSINYAPSPFIPFHGTTYSPSAGAPDMPAVLNYSERPSAITPPTVSPQQYQQHYPPSLQSHISPQTPSRGLDLAGSSLGFRDPYNEALVRLPPILPSPPTFAPHAPTYSHRRGDSYPTVATYQTLSSPQHELSPHVQESPRSMLESLPTRTELRSPFPSIPGTQNVMPPGPDERSPHRRMPQSQSTIMSPTAEPVNQRRRKSEASNDENPQPAKRRRMAVDDIVNG